MRYTAEPCNEARTDNTLGNIVAGMQAAGTAALPVASSYLSRCTYLDWALPGRDAVSASYVNARRHGPTATRAVVAEG